MGLQTEEGHTASRSRTRQAISPMIPFAVYCAVTVVGPFLRHAGRREGFYEHAIVATLVPSCIVLLWTGSAFLLNKVRRWFQGPRTRRVERECAIKSTPGAED